VVIEEQPAGVYLLNTYTAKARPQNHGERFPRIGRYARHRRRELFRSLNENSTELISEIKVTVVRHEFLGHGANLLTATTPRCAGL
jgi:hypothetical protein